MRHLCRVYDDYAKQASIFQPILLKNPHEENTLHNHCLQSQIQTAIIERMKVGADKRDFFAYSTR